MLCARVCGGGGGGGGVSFWVSTTALDPFSRGDLWGLGVFFLLFFRRWLNLLRSFVSETSFSSLSFDDTSGSTQRDEPGRA